MAAMLLYSSLFVLAHAATYYNCTMPPRDGECSICKNCVYVVNNFGCKKFGAKRHAATKSVKKCLSQDASCGGEQERCFGALYECEPGYERPDGSSDHAVTCKNGRLNYGQVCVKKISCTAQDTTTAKLTGKPKIAGRASAKYECKSGWENAAGSPQVSSFVATCVRDKSTPGSDRGVLSPSPASQCAIRPGCTDATMSNFDAEATVDDGSCAECSANSDCSDEAKKPVCDTVNSICVECLAQSDCVNAGSSQMCDSTKTCQCAKGFKGTPGLDGMCTAKNQCVLLDSTECEKNRACAWDDMCVAKCVDWDTKEACLADESCVWELGQCSVDYSLAKMMSDNSMSLMALVVLIGLVLCCCLGFCCYRKKKSNPEEDREHKGQWKNRGTRSMRSAGTHRSERSNAKARAVE